MDETTASRYWCYMCSQIVHPIMGIEIKCPNCQNGFVEEMSSGSRESQEPDLDFGSERALSLWAPILLGMMGNRRRRRRLRRMDFDEDEDENGSGERESELDREFEALMMRSTRRRSSASILQLLQGIRAGIASETENSEDGAGAGDRERERVILINPLNRTIIVQGSYDSRNRQNQNNHIPIGSLGDYFVGPGLDLLLQHLAENDPNRYGTPPAQKEAIEALPTVKIKDVMQCSVCLDDFEMGSEAKEMPCKHKFHSGCLLPWLELHSSCPVCRFQLPAEESKNDPERSRNSARSERNPDQTHNESSTSNDDNNTASSSNNESNENEASGTEAGGERRSGNGRRFGFLWPFNGLFSSSSSRSHSNSRADET